MNNRLKILIAAVIILFVGVNCFLLFKEDNKIKRTSYVKNWKMADKEDLRKTLSSAGVVVPSDKQYIQHDTKKGSFNKFLVKKGDKVKAGTPLYSYIPENDEALTGQLEAEKSAIQGEIDSTDAHIESLTSYKSSLDTSSSADSSSSTASDSAAADENQKSDDEMKVFELEKDIFALEADKSRLEARLSGIESQLSALNSAQSEISVQSEIEGTVQNVRQDLHNPLITIAASATSVQGILSEGNRKNVKEGMNVKVYAKKDSGKSNGELAEVSAAPEKEPKVKRKSQYAYTASLSNQKPFRIIGSHVNVEIIMKEAKNAITVPASAVFKEKKKFYVYLLQKDGLVHKTKVETGFKSGSKTEIKSGLKSDDAVIADYKDAVENKGPFFTPFHAEKVRKPEVKRLFENKVWLIPFITGIKEG